MDERKIPDSAYLRTCDYCGQDFDTRKQGYARADQPKEFCSKACVFDWMAQEKIRTQGKTDAG